MARRYTLKGKVKKIETVDTLKLVDEFINDSFRGRRTKKNGTRISAGTITNYNYLKKALHAHVNNGGEFVIHVSDRLTQREKERVNKEYKRFYQRFTGFMYSKKGYYDNYVGLIIKCLRSFFNYLETERNISVGSYHRSFYVPVESIPIIALSPDQLRYIMHDQEFIKRVEEEGLSWIRDIFIFGCTVALRVSDLVALEKKNLQITDGRYYITVTSKKTHTRTQVKLPDYCVEILKKYKGKQKTLLPKISPAYLNSRLKKMACLIRDNTEMVKTRERRGKQIVVYKDEQKKTHYTLADHVSTHTMRRTAITTMLSLGMPEHIVRKISGHAANSKEFFRYVQLAQEHIDRETEGVFQRLSA